MCVRTYVRVCVSDRQQGWHDREIGKQAGRQTEATTYSSSTQLQSIYARPSCMLPGRCLVRPTLVCLPKSTPTIKKSKSCKQASKQSKQSKNQARRRNWMKRFVDMWCCSVGHYFSDDMCHIPGHAAVLVKHAIRMSTYHSHKYVYTRGFSSARDKSDTPGAWRSRNFECSTMPPSVEQIVRRNHALLEPYLHRKGYTACTMDTQELRRESRVRCPICVQPELTRLAAAGRQAGRQSSTNHARPSCGLVLLMNNIISSLNAQIGSCACVLCRKK